MMQDKDNNWLSSAEDIINNARRYVKTAINSVMVYAYYEIGRMIVENEQHGKSRAAYGKQILKELSEFLTDKFGKGFSVDNLENMRRFYLAYSDRISETASRILTDGKSETVSRKLNEIAVKEIIPFTLSYSHYIVLSRIKDDNARRFYEIEAEKGNWSVKALSRQIGSSLYERLALSRNKDEVMRLASEGQTVEKPSDLVKDPYVLEFLGLKEESAYSESELETRIIDHLQDFLMEMGKGFTFVGRQVRFTFDEEHFKVDLVLYNRLLRCFVVIDLKIGKLKHQDLGQMQMYVNYYDRYEKQPDENPTIGILLCSNKNDNMVRLTLPENSNIYASKYELYLPDKALLQKKLEEWLAEENDKSGEVK